MTRAAFVTQAGWAITSVLLVPALAVFFAGCIEPEELLNVRREMELAFPDALFEPEVEFRLGALTFGAAKAAGAPSIPKSSRPRPSRPTRSGWLRLRCGPATMNWRRR